MSKRGLGRGIDALLQGFESADAPVQPGSGVTNMLPIDQIAPNPNQPRKSFSEESLQELADSVRSRGILQPILVEQVDDGSYMIIAGERRYRAARRAGLAEVPVIVRSFTEEEKLEIALIENIQREDLNPIEEAQAYRSLMDSTGVSQDELSSRLGKNRSTVANSLRLLKLPEEVQRALTRGELTAGHARALLALSSPNDLVTLFRRIIGEGLSVREAEAEARAMSGGRPTERPKASSTATVARKSVELRELEERLITALGTKVTVSGSHEKGRIEINYYSLDDLERLTDLLDR